MASKRRIRRKSCERKRRYSTFEHAQADLQRFNLLNPRGPNNFRKQVYGPCQFCKGYHIGTPKAPKRAPHDRNKSGLPLSERLQRMPHW